MNEQSNKSSEIRRTGSKEGLEILGSFAYAMAVVVIIFENLEIKGAIFCSLSCTEAKPFAEKKVRL